MAKEYVEERIGGYYLAGTRVSFDSIVHCFHEGLSPEAILGEFETLTLTQVFGAITFYLENQPVIDDYRVRQQQRFDAPYPKPRKVRAATRPFQGLSRKWEPQPRRHDRAAGNAHRSGH